MPAADPEPTRQFASNVRRAMAAKGLAAAAVADRADLSLNHLNLILAGRRTVQLDTLVKLAGALGVPPERLLEGVEWVSDGRGGGEFRTARPGGSG
jgi:transcriptional regulator with XRE-family HTH domain